MLRKKLKSSKNKTLLHIIFLLSIYSLKLFITFLHLCMCIIISQDDLRTWISYDYMQNISILYKRIGHVWFLAQAGDIS